MVYPLIASSYLALKKLYFGKKCLHLPHTNLLLCMKTFIKHCFFGILFYVSIVLFFTTQNNLYAQYTIDMEQTIAECLGNLADSGLGEEQANFYDHGANYTFTVCIPDAVTIFVYFDEFSTELAHDYLYIYAGNDTLGNILGGPYSGPFLPPPLVLNQATLNGDTCITFQFISDLNVADVGFNLHWEAILNVPPPLPPFNLPNADCFQNQILLSLSEPVLCSTIAASGFILSGPNAPIVAEAQPIGCDAAGFTQTVQVTFAEPLSQSGNYQLGFDYTYVDICGQEWYYGTQAGFFVANCPLEIVAVDAPTYSCGACLPIQLTVTGGDLNYTYTWDTQPPTTSLPSGGSPIICPTEPTTYFVTVSDGYGQTDTAEFMVDVCPFEVGINLPSLFCGDCADVSAIVTGGAPTYNFVWNVPTGNAPLGNVGTANICPLQGGAYSVTVTDAFGATASATATMEVCPLQININPLLDFCEGNCQMLSANASGGGGIYSYQWQPSLPNQAQNQICDLLPTTYSVTVSDQFGATATAALTTQICPLNTNIITANLACNECQTIETQTQGGGSGSYSYEWDVQPPNGDNPANGLVCPTQPTTYSVTVTDTQTGQTATAQAFTDVCPYTIQISVPTLICETCETLSANVQGGEPPYTYIWQPDLGNVSTAQICPTVPITYNVTVTDAAGNTLSASTNIDVCPLQVDLMVPNVVCDTIAAEQCIAISVDVSGGDYNSYSFTWSDPNLVGPGPHQVCDTSGTQYSVTVTDSNGNSAADSGWFLPCPLYLNFQYPECVSYGSCDSLYMVAVGGNWDYSFAWSDPSFSPDEGWHTICPTQATTYTVSVTSGTTTYVINGTVEMCPIGVDVTADIENACNTCANLQVEAANGIEPYSFVWSNGWVGTGPFNDCPAQTTLYSVTVTDAAGASASDEVSINVEPMSVQLDAPPLLCGGTGGAITALVNCGYPPYSFAWSQDFGNSAGPHTLNLDASTTYIVTVTDINGTTVSAAAFISVNAIPDLGSSSTLCNNDAPLPLIGSAAGWAGNGVLNGTFDPAIAGPGQHDLTFTDNGCSAVLTITVNEAPQTQGGIAICLGGILTQLTANPEGGTWAGSPQVSSVGLFNPSIAGNYNLTYTALNGCLANQAVSVADVSVSVNMQNVCSSPVQVSVTPDIGYFSDNSAFDPATYIFNPALSGLGYFTLYYQSPGGCIDTVGINVFGVLSDTLAYLCPQQGTIFLPDIINEQPSGGQWTSSGLGLQNAAGLFDALAQGGNSFTEYLTYTIDGCSIQTEILVSQTFVTFPQLDFCFYDNMYSLAGIGLPVNGEWSGNGIIFDIDSQIYYFDPQTAGIGSHALTYTANDCVANCTAVVHSVNAGNDLSLCGTSSPVTLGPPQPLGGTWSGVGINPNTGIFNPIIAGVGIHSAVYTSPDGCMDTLSIDIFPQATAIIDSMQSYFCYNDTAVVLSGTPAGGVFAGQGVVGDIFNPIQAGPGGYLLTYTYSAGGCQSVAYLPVSVGDPLAILMPNDTSICSGSSTLLTAQAYNGSSFLYNYVWDNGLGYGQNHVITPEETHTYTVTVGDGCSQPITGDMTVTVSPPLNYTIETSPIICEGDTGFIKVIVPPGSPYQFNWSNDSALHSTEIEALTGYYELTVLDTLTQCAASELIEIPDYSTVYADFSLIPNNNDCLNTLQISFLDASLGAQNGQWDFGDGSTEAYQYGVYPSHNYSTPGQYTVSLRIENEGGCESVKTQTFCIALANDIVVPNAFSPNGDLVNDIFRAVGINITNFSMEIYNRWGVLLFETNDMTQGWDGRYAGKDMEIGAYVYQINYTVGNKTRSQLLKGNVFLIR